MSCPWNWVKLTIKIKEIKMVWVDSFLCRERRKIGTAESPLCAFVHNSMEYEHSNKCFYLITCCIPPNENPGEWSYVWMVAMNFTCMYISLSAIILCKLSTKHTNCVTFFQRHNCTSTVLALILGSWAEDTGSGSLYSGRRALAVETSPTPFSQCSQLLPCSLQLSKEMA